MSDLLYFLLDTKTNLYWDGRYHAHDWSARPRFFRTLAALGSSINLKSRVPQCFIDELVKTHPEPKKPEKGDYGQAWQDYRHWKHDRYLLWNDHIKANKLTSKHIFKMYAAQGRIVYVLEEGAAINSAKPV